MRLGAARCLERGSRAGRMGIPRRPIYVTSPPRAWHKVVVDVTPESINAFWDGQFVGEFARAQLVKNAQRDFALFPVDPTDAQPEFPCRGALGLYVFNATGSFRSVTIAPLDKANQ